MISGTFKAIVGFLIINAGAGVIVNALLIFQPMWAQVFGLEAQAITGFVGFERFSQEYGGAVTLAMTFGFLINVLLARFTKLKYIYLTGHMMFWTTLIFAGVVVHSVGPDVQIVQWQLVLFLSVLMGLYWTIQPALTQPFMRKVTGQDNIALGHTSAGAALLGAWLGKFVGKPEDSAENLKLPEGLNFLKDANVIIALVMSLLYLVGAVILLLKPSNEAIAGLIANAGSQNFVMYSLVEAFRFAGGIAVVLFGVRMLIGEIVPAFRGIATRIVPDAKPALDCPVVYPYAPTAAIMGFLGAFVGALLWLTVIGNTVGYVFVPTMIVLFFHAATAGVFGNATGGLRGALLAGFVTSTIVAWGQYVMVTFYISSTIPDTAMWAADTDMFILGPLVAFLARLFF